MSSQRPSPMWLVTEPARSLAEFGAFAASMPWLERAPRGDGHTVLVLPGLLATDTSTIVLRRFLGRLGYRAVGWGMGRNIGPSRAVLERLPVLLRLLAEQSGRPVTMVGWSLGGLYARGLAVGQPELVRQVVTLGSPYASSEPGQTHADTAFRLLSRGRGDLVPVGDGEKAIFVDPLCVPTTSVYTKHDGIVSWRICREDSGDERESIGVPGSHLGLGHNPAVLWLLADRLAQPQGVWAPFTPPDRLRGCYSVDAAPQVQPRAEAV